MKLCRRNYPLETISKVISTCQRLKYIDDGTTAALYVAERKRKHYGPCHIKQQMQKKGFSAADIERALKDGYSFEDQLAHARVALLKKSNQLPQKIPPTAARQKLYNHLRYRGFSPQIIHQILTENSHENDI